MEHRDTTSTGGPERAFRTTIWSDILAAGDRSNPRWKEKLSGLCVTYWKPVYAYIRVAWKKPAHDAKDLTQGFFARFLEKGYLSHLHPDRGSFRGYLKTALRHFLINAKEAESAQNGHGPVLSLDAAPEDLESLGLSAPGDTPERAYDREWFRGLIRASVEELQTILRREGKDLYFEVFRVYCLDPEGTKLQDVPAPTYQEIADRLQLKENDVRNYLSYCRRRLKDVVRNRVLDYVGTEDDVEGEIREAAGI